MRILVSALSCVPFVIKHIMLENFVPTPTQALLRFWIQWLRPNLVVVVPEPRFTHRVLQWIEDENPTARGRVSAEGVVCSQTAAPE